MTGTPQTPIGIMTCGQNQPTQDVNCMTRKVSFVVYCAPLDQGNSMYSDVYGNDTSHRGVTDSASYLTGLPYVVVNADTNDVIYPYNSANGVTARFPAKVALPGNASLHDGTRWVHSLPPINIPDHVTRITLHIASDAYRENRRFQLFPWTVPDAAHSKVRIYELRSDLQDKFAARNPPLANLPENTLAAKQGADNEYYGYLNGDLWLKISPEYDDGAITRLCPPETLTRTALHGQVEGEPISEQAIVDWMAVLQPIYAAGANSRSMAPFNVRIVELGITVSFADRALANAINTSNRTTVQQALRRTSPRTFAALLKAAWRLHIDTVAVSSSWRPMLGSSLHKMGIGLDVVRFDDGQENIHFLIHNHGPYDRNHAFPTGPAGQKMAALYQELTADHEVSGSAVYTPWINWIQPHDTHMHVTVKAG
ncbi:hypothetical protein [Paraburkholderia sp.]|uniref:hypothetical protein n=1 Tax=Paraburkholderia sp. TaxID=1926495 RepID=UPI002D331FD2|nr:hypothetical protein [Paraburkholderia sp.]HZZ06630.1 hypothetical protein [Paraburkholderia sp.]